MAAAMGSSTHLWQHDLRRGRGRCCDTHLLDLLPAMQRAAWRRCCRTCKHLKEHRTQPCGRVLLSGLETKVRTGCAYLNPQGQRQPAADDGDLCSFVQHRDPTVSHSYPVASNLSQRRIGLANGPSFGKQGSEPFYSGGIARVTKKSLNPT